MIEGKQFLKDYKKTLQIHSFPTGSEDVSAAEGKNPSITSEIEQQFVQSPSGSMPLSAFNVISGTGGGSSTASSRDTSPCRELSPLVTNLKAPITLRREQRGIGFTVHTIRVYYGDTDFYTMHHLVMAVDEKSQAYQAGLRPADLITHVNGEAVQGLFHTQVLQLLLNNGHDHVTLRTTPLEYTSIQTGGRRRDVHQSKLAKKSVSRQKKQRKDAEKKRKTSLFRRISTKRASAEMQHLTSGLPSPGSVTPSRSCQSFSQNVSGPREEGLCKKNQNPFSHLIKLCF